MVNFWKTQKTNLINFQLAALRLGRIIISGKQITQADYRLKGHDTIFHVHHRHEHPILDKPITIIADTKDMLVVNKPPSLPVHACGQYKVNTVLGLLWKLHGISGLRRKCFFKEEKNVSS